jgi:ABC-type nitrate/sulfonate/bicarbonate transport system substrate-binding protein
MFELTPRAREHVRALFAPSQWEAVEADLVRDCGHTLPGFTSSDAAGAERIRIAVLKLSNGHHGQLRHWIREAGFDWRDVLMAAGFGEDTKAHLHWKPG